MLYKSRSEQINNLYKSIYNRNAHADEISGWIGSQQNIPTINQNLQKSFDRDGDQLAPNLRASLQIQPNTPSTPTTPTTPTTAPAPSTPPSAREQINNSYIEHYNRNAAPEEIANWRGTGKTNETIDQLLQESFARDGEHLGAAEVAALQIQPDIPTPTEPQPDPVAVDQETQTGVVDDQQTELNGIIDALNEKIEGLEGSLSTAGDTYKELLDSQADTLRGELDAQNLTHKDAIKTLTDGFNTTIGNNTNASNLVIGGLQDDIRGLNTTMSNNAAANLENIRGITAAFDARYATQASANLDFIGDLTKSFDDRYDTQNTNNLNALSSLRTELTGSMEAQAGRYDDTIRNMIATNNTNRLAQEDRYMSNIETMTNTHAEQQRQLRDTLNSQANPHSRQSQVGVQAPNAQGQAGAAMLQARGTKGTFNRQGLRIQGLNI